MKIFINPQPQQFPVRGGVREHLRLLYRFLSKHVEITPSPYDADILHVESTWDFPNLDKPKVYVCHGGFIPSPLPIVLKNLTYADVVVTVANWISDRFFSIVKDKTVYIPNGVDMAELSRYRNTSKNKNSYILYGKEWAYYLDDFEYLVYNMPEQKFVSTIWVRNDVPKNLEVIGLQPRARMLRFIEESKFLLITGSEVCPTMLLEAWGMGTPVLAKGIDGSLEIIKKHSVPFSVYENTDDLYFKAKQLTSDTGYNSLLVDIIREKYNWENIAKQYVEVYEKLLC